MEQGWVFKLIAGLKIKMAEESKLWIQKNLSLVIKMLTGAELILSVQRYLFFLKHHV